MQAIADFTHCFLPVFFPVTGRLSPPGSLPLNEQETNKCTDMEDHNARTP
jgi:hypothetical protein